MFTTTRQIRVSTFELSCGLSSSAALGIWEEETRVNATRLSSPPPLSQSIHHSMHREGNCYLQNVVLLRHWKCGALHDAVSFFDTMDKDLYSWNIMMSIYNRFQDGGDKVLVLFNKMQQEAEIPNKFILASIISACARQGDLYAG